MNSDSHQSFKKIIAAGFTNQQAELLVDLIYNVRDHDLSKLASKEQITLYNQHTEDHFCLLEQKVDDKFDFIEPKIENRFQLADQKTEDHFNLLEQKIELYITKLESRMAKQDALQKTWMMGMLLTIIGAGAAIILKMHS